MSEALLNHLIPTDGAGGTNDWTDINSSGILRTERIIEEGLVEK